MTTGALVLRISVYALAALVKLQELYFSGRRFRLEGGTPEERAIWRDRVHDYATSLSVSLPVSLYLVVTLFVWGRSSARAGRYRAAILHWIASAVCAKWLHDTFWTLSLSFT